MILHQLQTTWMLWFQGIVSGVFSDGTLIFIARYVPWLFGLAIVGITLFESVRSVIMRTYHHFHKFFIGAVATFLMALLVQWLLKQLFSFGRPFTSGVPALYEYGSYDTFPSGHALVFMALAVFMYQFNTWWGIVFIGLALCIGLARIAVGVHWPIDIIGGWIVGACVGYVMIQVTKML